MFYTDLSGQCVYFEFGNTKYSNGWKGVYVVFVSLLFVVDRDKLVVSEGTGQGFKSRETEFRRFCFRLSGLMCLM